MSPYMVSPSSSASSASSCPQLESAHSLVPPVNEERPLADINREAEIKSSKKSQPVGESSGKCTFPSSMTSGGRTMLTHRRETEYIAWSLPKSPIASSKGPSLEPRAKARRVRVNLIALCSPGSPIFSGKHSHFTATVETRCVRDIKRPHSWKIYGVECGQGVTAHYVRIQLADDCMTITTALWVKFRADAPRSPGQSIPHTRHPSRLDLREASRSAIQHPPVRPRRRLRRAFAAL